MTLRLITEMLSEEQVGVYYIFVTVVSLLAFGFFNPLGQFYGRHLIHWQQTASLKTATNAMLILRCAAMPFALLLAVIIFYAMDYQQYLSLAGFTILIFISLLALTHGVLLNAINVLVSRITFAVYSVLTLITGLILSIIFIRLYQTAIAWIYGLALAQIIFSFILYKLIVFNQKFSLVKIQRALNKDYIKRFILFIFPVTITLFLQWGQSTSFRFIVEDLYSVKVLAFVSVGMALSGAIFSALESLAAQFYMPLYLKKITNATQQTRTLAWNELASTMLPIYIAVAVYVIAFAPYLTKLLVAGKFQDAYIYTMIGAFIELFRVTTNLVYLVSQSEVKTKGTITPYLVGFLIMIASLYSIDVSEPLWKIPALLAFSYLATLIIMVYNMIKLLPIEIDVSIAVKMLMLASPLLLVNLSAIELSIFNAFFVLGAGGIYLLLIQYFLLKTKIKNMSSI